jgi:hypothetical protein
MWVLITQRLVVDFFWHIIYFPFWWYSDGVKYTALYCVRIFRFANDFMAPLLWLRNIFVPMFGQSDWQGRVVSFFMRLVNVIFRGIGLLIWSAIVLTIFVAWILWPIFIFYILYIAF